MYSSREWEFCWFCSHLILASRPIAIVIFSLYLNIICIDYEDCINKDRRRCLWGGAGSSCGRRGRARGRGAGLGSHQGSQTCCCTHTPCPPPSMAPEPNTLTVRICAQGPSKGYHPKKAVPKKVVNRPIIEFGGMEGFFNWSTHGWFGNDHSGT